MHHSLSVLFTEHIFEFLLVVGAVFRELLVRVVYIERSCLYILQEVIRVWLTTKPMILPHPTLTTLLLSADNHDVLVDSL